MYKLGLKLLEIAVQFASAPFIQAWAMKRWKVHARKSKQALYACAIG